MKQIEEAIGALSEPELTELYDWLDQHYPQPFDLRIATDLEAGRIDAAISRALEDEKNGRDRPL